MRKFSKMSQDRLNTCHPDLIKLFERVIQIVDCTVLEGHRGKEAQDEAVRTGHSKTPWPQSKHNSTPSKACDVAPYPVQWTGEKARARFYHFAGVVRGVAAEMGIKIRCGCDWDSDFDLFDQTFFDLPHFEIVELFIPAGGKVSDGIEI